mmetsp:Transcript_19626/g.35005  ORF Transcript_19626/g.35005 Transcript_19626/m.35005 type:complete len:220 (-) Transcript_19626:25-684(-)|eukprot:CAMPEP_0197526780 /NCGR_PEP_ID=MMETSP1318-20131121/19327_1 /TAXON_ID=552666 /ORGANISM="Partenskyella glossopodia, Strain RCC365" /LENGTH=219 /DNA_ID=CAMNT_0043081111 /DNA_START=40 /DNA_END=699 /DNA_ORIENTATION=-
MHARRAKSEDSVCSVGECANEAEGEIPSDMRIERTCSHASASRLWKNIKFSKGYLLLVVLVCLLCFVVMVWELSGADSKHWLPLACEGLINAILVIDVTFDISSQGWKNYISQLVNVIDFVVTVTCTGLFLVLVAREESSGVYDDELSEVDVAFLCARYVFMVIRIWVVFHKAQRGAEMRQQDDVDFTKVESDNDDEDVTEPLHSGGRTAVLDDDLEDI